MTPIINALREIKGLGSFCNKRSATIDSLSLNIKNVGELACPFSKKEIKSLINVAQPAKFGWRDKTLLDTKVRNAWEIPGKNIKFEPSWNKKLNEVLLLLKEDLGFSNEVKLKTSLHNLLIYEAGQFFSPHQDSEKQDGMVASLVVILPSEHSEGSLIIEHQGEKKKFQTSKFSLDKIHFIAFYADCFHEVTKVKSGYRIALTYNIILEQKIENNIPKFENTKLASLLNSVKNYFSENEPIKKNIYSNDLVPKKFIYLLDHNYTQKGLLWSYLKNEDNIRAEALKAVAKELDLEISIALADIQEIWNCESDYDDYYNYRHKNRYRYHDNEDDEEEEDEQSSSNSDNYAVTDLCDSNVTLRHWISEKSTSLNYGECSIRSSEIGWIKETEKFKPFKSEHEGWMGNYGNTVERWYHRAAVVLWQKKDHYSILFNINGDNVIKKLLTFKRKKSPTNLLQEIVHSILPYFSSYTNRNDDIQKIFNVLELALDVKESQLATDLLKNFNVHALVPDTTEIFLSLENQYGTPWCLDILQKWIDSERTSFENFKFKDIFSLVKNISSKKELTKWILSFQLKKIKEQNFEIKKHSTRASLLKKSKMYIEDMCEFLTACVLMDYQTLFIQGVEHIINEQDIYPVLELVTPVTQIEKKLSKLPNFKIELQKLIQHIVFKIKEEQEQGLRKSNDWSIKEIAPCTCQDCNTLIQFLHSSTEQNKIWPLGESRRRHIHNQINNLDIPVTQNTERKGSPFKLILTKKDDLHTKSKNRFERLKKELKNIENINL